LHSNSLGLILASVLAGACKGRAEDSPNFREDPKIVISHLLGANGCRCLLRKRIA
jgi:hypothetical protein